MARQLLRRVLMLTCVAAIVALTPLSAQAQSEVTITVGATGTLQSRIVARVPVQITCAPMEVAFGDTGGTIRQAAGREIAHGSGGGRPARHLDRLRRGTPPSQLHVRGRSR